MSNIITIEEGIRRLKEGTPIAFPTETVYGVGVPFSFSPEILYQVKGRKPDKPIALLIQSIEQVHDIIEISEVARNLIKEHFPGPLTLVLPRKKGKDCLGIRMPDHPLTLMLIKEVGEPLWASSANLSGQPDATSAEVVALGDLGVIDGGACQQGQPSTVLRVVGSNVEILRKGALPFS